MINEAANAIKISFSSVFLLEAVFVEPARKRYTRRSRHLLSSMYMKCARPSSIFFCQVSIIGPTMDGQIEKI